LYRLALRQVRRGTANRRALGSQSKNPCMAGTMQGRSSAKSEEPAA